MVPQCVSQTQDLEIAVKGESGTGHIKVFLVSGRGVGGCVCVRRGWGSDVPFLEVSFFWPGFDVKVNWSCFDGVVCCAVFNIHAADQERRGERSGEEIFGQTES